MQFDDEEAKDCQEIRYIFLRCGGSHETALSESSNKVRWITSGILLNLIEAPLPTADRTTCRKQKDT